VDDMMIAKLRRDILGTTTWRVPVNDAGAPACSARQGRPLDRARGRARRGQRLAGRQATR
jgi:hypothetical protein